MHLRPQRKSSQRTPKHLKGLFHMTNRFNHQHGSHTARVYASSTIIRSSNVYQAYLRFARPHEPFWNDTIKEQCTKAKGFWDVWMKRHCSKCETFHLTAEDIVFLRHHEKRFSTVRSNPLELLVTYAHLRSGPNRMSRPQICFQKYANSSLWT